MTISSLSPQESDDAPFEPPAPAGATYVIHALISINGNSAFATQAAAESWSGDGSAGNPYIIQNYNIDSSSAIGISIQNTTVHFIVRDCYIHGTGSSYSWSIYLNLCIHGNLINNSCSNDYYGIGLESSSDNTISDNYCSDNEYGIYLWYSDNNILSKNTCSSNNGYGIWLLVSNGNTVSDNNCFGNEYGISLWTSSDDNILKNNTCSSNNREGLILRDSIDNTLNNNTCSSNSWDGILLLDSNGNIVSDNNCSNNVYDGIYLASSSNNTIFWNRFCNNTLQGAYITSGSNNTIWNNTFIGNNGADSIYNPSHVQASDGGADNRWNSSGTPHGYGNYWSDLSTPDINGDGIVDWSYNMTGSAGAKDHYPQTTAQIIPEPPILVLMPLMLIAFVLISRRNKKKE